MRPGDFICVDIIFMSLRRPSCSDCRLHGVFAVNISVHVITRQYQNLTADGEGVTVSISSWWRWQWCRADRWQEGIGRWTLLQLFGGGELKLWVAWWSPAWPEGDGDSYIFNGCLGVLTQLLVTAHPTCHGTRPTSPSNRPSFRHLNNLVHVFTERWQSQVHWPLYTSQDE